MPDPNALADHPQLRPLLPFVYVAWSDGVLADEEIRALRQHGARLCDGAATAAVLDDWLDPDSPPTQTELLRALRLIRALATELPDSAREGLAEFAGSLAADVDDATLAGLHDVEAILGVGGREAVDRMLEPQAPVRQDFDEPAPRFDAREMRRWLDGAYAERWDAVRETLTQPGFTHRYDQSTAEYREQVLSWLRVLADEGLGRLGLPVEMGGAPMPHFIHTFAALAMFDLSLVVKYGVQFGLWAGSVRFLGTADHHAAYLGASADAELLGAFAMTEMGHGSNVRQLETTATYDAIADEFVVNTPTPSARKEWIGNAAAHGRIASVFAQLVLDGQSHGVHAFVVPIRDHDGSPLPGVRLADCGHKMGLNGVDNGRIWFEQVRIPAANLLDRFASVDPATGYSSPIQSQDRRFFTMLGTLVAGRICVGFSAVSASRSALAIAIRYGALRRQFGPAGGGEVRILDYRSHQTRLMPALAATYALHASFERLARDFEARSEDAQRELEARAAGLKALATWHAIDAAQAARECCGGQGFLSQNRISEIRKDVDVFATFEGDNTVLLQLVAKSLLSDYADDFADDFVFTLVKQIARRAGVDLFERNPFARRKTDDGHLDSPEFQIHALRFRSHNLLVSLARRLKRRIDKGVEPFHAFADVQDHVIALAKAHTEQVIAQDFAAAVAAAPAGPERDALDRLRALDGLTRIRDDIGWFIENGYIAANKAAAVRNRFLSLCADVRHDAVAYCDAFGIPDSVLAAPIAFEDYIEG